MSLLAPLPDFGLAAGDRGFHQRLSGIAELGTTICVLESLRRGTVLWWQFALVAVFSLVIARYSRAAVGRLASQSILRMRRRLVRSVLHLPLLELETIGATRLLVAFTGDVGSVATAVRNLSSLSANAAILLACLAYIGWLSTREMVVAGLLCLVCIAGAVFLRLLEKRYRHASRESWDKVVSVFRMVLDGIKQLKLNRSLARRVLMSFEERLREQQRAAAARRRYSEFVASWIQAMSYVILGSVVFDPYGADASLKLGFGLLIVLQIRRPLRALIVDSGAYADALVAFERLSELGLTLTERHREPDDWQHAPALRDWRSLDLKGVHFRYGDENSGNGFNIGPMDMALRRGEVVFIGGGNGSGKTTLAKVLTGLYTPTSGTIQFDGVDVDEHNFHWYRKKFAAVFSDFCLFEAVAILSPTTWAIKSIGFLFRLGLAVDARLSSSQNESNPFTSGERARIAPLRAVIEDRPVFVFDEWAADQVHEYKDFFYEDSFPG